MEIAFTGGAFTKVTRADSWGCIRVLESLEFECVGGPGGLRNLGSEGGGDGVLVWVVRSLF